MGIIETIYCRDDAAEDEVGDVMRLGVVDAVDSRGHADGVGRGALCAAWRVLSPTSENFHCTG